MARRVAYTSAGCGLISEGRGNTVGFEYWAIHFAAKKYRRGWFGGFLTSPGRHEVVDGKLLWTSTFVALKHSRQAHDCAR